MRRMACVDLPSLPLQLLLVRHPDWRGEPAAVVERDHPQGYVLWANDAARARGVRPGMRYAAALSLAGGLRAAEVPAADLERTVAALVARLGQFSPGVEPSSDDPGVFWLDASGLGALYESLAEWARRIREALRRYDLLEATVVVGFRRFGTLVLAKAARGIRIIRNPDDEAAAARRVSLDHLLGTLIEPQAYETLARLGVHAVGEFLDLPPEGVRRRFGETAWRLHREGRGEVEVPLSPERVEEPLERTMHLDHEETDRERLLVLVEMLLAPLLEILRERDLALAEIVLHLRFDRSDEGTEHLRLAAPTLDRARILELVRLRFESMRLSSGVTTLRVEARAVRPQRKQLELFAEAPRRDLTAASRALARLRALFGDRAVVRASLRDGHLPEALFDWEPLVEIDLPEPCGGETGALIRRLYDPPIILPARPRHEPDGWMLRGLEQGPVARVLGPYVISGGWWQRAVHREYHFAETQKGEILWVYYDRFRRRWFVQGRVE